ncbi:MAG: nucleoid-associated protein YgaU [Pirellulaceae bacterium]|jgi:nucleoid-associated protein YgaU
MTPKNENDAHTQSAAGTTASGTTAGDLANIGAASAAQPASGFRITGIVIFLLCVLLALSTVQHVRSYWAQRIQLRTPAEIPQVAQRPPVFVISGTAADPADSPAFPDPKSSPANPAANNPVYAQQSETVAPTDDRFSSDRPNDAAVAAARPIGPVLETATGRAILDPARTPQLLPSQVAKSSLTGAAPNPTASTNTTPVFPAPDSAAQADQANVADPSNIGPEDGNSAFLETTAPLADAIAAMPRTADGTSAQPELAIVQNADSQPLVGATEIPPAPDAAIAPSIITSSANALKTEPLPATTAASINEPTTIQVRQGDTFVSLAQKFYHSDELAQALFQYNRRRVAHPDGLAVGQIVELPSREILAAQVVDEPISAAPIVAARTTSKNMFHTVEMGDSLIGIAKSRLGNARRWPEIYRLNRDSLGESFDSLPKGLKLKLPADGILTRRVNSELK